MESTDAGETHTGMGKMRKSAMEVLVPPWFTPETERSLSPARGGEEGGWGVGCGSPGAVLEFSGIPGGAPKKHVLSPRKFGTNSV